MSIIGPESDLLPQLFDQVIERYSSKMPSAHLRARIVQQLLHAIEVAAARETNSARIRTTNPIGPTQYVPLVTYDRLAGVNLSKSALVNQISAELDLSAQILEIAVLMIEAHLDLALATQRVIKVRDIKLSYLRPDAETVSSVEPVDHTAWAKRLHEQLLHGVIRNRSWWSTSRKRSADIDMLSQGLLVGAAFRLAAPLQIDVPEYAIDSIIEGLDRSKPEVRLIQISDLHFCDSMYEKGRQSAGSGYMPTHSFDAAIELGEALQRMDRRYDVLLVTGDLTTHGGRRELLNAQEFITGAVIPGLNPTRIAAQALKASKGKRILLPGNHDIYGPVALRGQKPSPNIDFEDILGLPKRYPYAVGFRLHKEDEKKEDDKPLTIIFFVFNSSLAEDIADQGERLAVGNVSQGELSQALELATRIGKAHADDLYGQDMKFDPANSVRIGLLHHHPLRRSQLTRDFELDENLDPEVKGGWWSRTKEFLSDVFTASIEHAVRLRDSDEFIKTCWRCGIQIILFGHRHEAWGGSLDMRKYMKQDEGSRVLEPMTTPFGGASGNMHFVCCPSALEYKARQKGFFVLDVVNRDEVNLSLHSSSIQLNKIPGPFVKKKEIKISLAERDGDELLKDVGS